MGELKVDIAYGGDFYTFVDGDALDLILEFTTMPDSSTLGRK